MPSRTTATSKDGWDIVQICAQTLLALIALSFTVLFGVKQQMNAEVTLQLAASNHELARAQANTSEEQMKAAKAQVKNSLLPPLTSADPKQRDLAMYLATALDESFAAEVLTVLALHDPDQDRRNNARANLRILAHSQQEGIKEKAERGLDQTDIVSELRAKGLLKKLSDAEALLKEENVSGKEAALRLYHEVLSQLSLNSRKKLNQELLIDAEKDDREGHIDAAVGKYRALFAT